MPKGGGRGPSVSELGLCTLTCRHALFSLTSSCEGPVKVRGMSCLWGGACEEMAERPPAPGGVQLQVTCPEQGLEAFLLWSVVQISAQTRNLLCAQLSGKEGQLCVSEGICYLVFPSQHSALPHWLPAVRPLRSMVQQWRGARCLLCRAFP